MKPHDASCLLAKLSCMDDCERGKEVAQALDYQPLALASAATYVRQLRQNKTTSHFGWNDYLEKLSKGQRGSTETILAETNPSYQESMTTATTLAVEKAMTSDKIIHHTFSLLSVCAPQPVSQDIVINYILNVDEEIKDKEMIPMRIQRCSLILNGEDESGALIRVHQVVYDVINSLTSDFPEIQQLQTVDATVRSFIQFVESNVSVNWDDKESIVYSFTILSVASLITLSLATLITHPTFATLATLATLTTLAIFTTFATLTTLAILDRRVHNRLLKSHFPAHFSLLIPPSHPFLPGNPDPAYFSKTFLR